MTSAGKQVTCVKREKTCNGWKSRENMQRISSAGKLQRVAVAGKDITGGKRGKHVTGGNRRKTCKGWLLQENGKQLKTFVDSLLVRRERGGKREKKVTGGTLLLSLFLVSSGL